MGAFLLNSNPSDSRACGHLWFPIVLGRRGAQNGHWMMSTVPWSLELVLLSTGAYQVAQLDSRGWTAMPSFPFPGVFRPRASDRHLQKFSTCWVDRSLRWAACYRWGSIGRVSGWTCVGTAGVMFAVSDWVATQMSLTFWGNKLSS